MRIKEIKSMDDSNWIITLELTTKPAWWQRLLGKRERMYEQSFYSEFGYLWFAVDSIARAPVKIEQYLIQAADSERARRSYVKNKEYIR